MTLQKLHSSRTGSARPAPDYHVKCERGRYRVYDKQQRFRCEFATLVAAQEYMAMRSGAPSHNKALSDEGQTAVLCVIERQGKLFGE